MVRKLVEKLFRNIVLKRSINTATGRRTFYTTAEGGLKFLKPNIDQVDKMLYNTVKLFVNDRDVVWDVGANVGYFTLLAAGTANEGECLSIEPDTWLCNILHKTKMNNQDITINILPIAIANKVGISKFNIANRARAANYLEVSEGSTQAGGIREVKHVPTFTLDSLLEYYKQPTFLKIDTEGAEHLVFEGAQKVLDLKPKILIEVYQDSYPYITSELIKRGYTLYDANRFPELILLENNYSENIFGIPNKQ